MTTKEQERKALEQIRKIVEGLGEDSYIRTAFEGCFEIAEENIDNDFACSMKQRAESAEKKVGEYKKIRDELVEDNKALEERARKAEELFNTKNETAIKYYAAWKDAEEKAITNWNKFREQEEKVEAFQQEIIRLKARLFDMIDKEVK